MCKRVELKRGRRKGNRLGFPSASPGKIAAIRGDNCRKQQFISQIRAGKTEMHFVGLTNGCFAGKLYVFSLHLFTQFYNTHQIQLFSLWLATNQTKFVAVQPNMK